MNKPRLVRSKLSDSHAFDALAQQMSDLRALRRAVALADALCAQPEVKPSLMRLLLLIIPLLTNQFQPVWARVR